MKRGLSVLLALMLLLGMVTIAAAEAPQITWLIEEAGTTANESNIVLDKIEELTGVRVRAIQAAPGEFDTKLNTLIASKTLPDIMRVDLATANQLIQEGMVMPMDDLLRQYGQDVLNEIGDILPLAPANQIDGQTYMVVSSNTEYMENLAIRKDWLSNLGLEMPTDLDSLYDTLVAFTKNDPDQNGKDDTIGIVMTIAQNMQWENLFGTFGIAYNKPMRLEDGTVTTYMKHPHYLEAIAYLRKLYQAGVMDPDFATMPAMTAHEKLWSGQCGAYGFRSVGTTNNWYPGRYTFETTNDPADTFAYAQITGPYGECGSAKQYPKLKLGFVITSTCENPEAAMQLINFMFTKEGDELLYLGVPDVMWRWVDEANGQYERLGEYTDDATHRSNGGFVYWPDMLKDGVGMRTLNPLSRNAQLEQQKHAIEWAEILREFEADTEYGTLLKDIEKEALATLIVTDGDVETEYAAFVERWDSEGGLEWQEQATEAYAAQQ